MSLFDYFDRARIINLPARADRREETKEEFSRYDFPIGTEKVRFFEAFSPSDSKGFPNPGVHGCFLSHMQIILDAHDDKLKNILVMEDDICFSKSIVQFADKAVEELKQMDWDIAYFGHTFPNDASKPSWKPLNEPTIWSHFYAINGKTLPEFSRFLKTIIERPAGHPEGGPMHYDGAINTFREQNPDIKAFCFSANLGYQRPSKTDLHETSFYDRYTLLTPVVRSLRKVKTIYMRMKS